MHDPKSFRGRFTESLLINPIRTAQKNEVFH